MTETDIHELITQTADEEVMQTFIDRYIEQSRQQGLFAGRQEDRLEERQALLLRQLTRKFGVLAPAQRHRVEQADSETLLRWAGVVRVDGRGSLALICHRAP